MIPYLLLAAESVGKNSMFVLFILHYERSFTSLCAFEMSCFAADSKDEDSGTSTQLNAHRTKLGQGVAVTVQDEAIEHR